MGLKQPDAVDRVIEFVAFRFDQELDRWQVIAALGVAVLVLLYSGYNLWRGWSARGVTVIAATANEKDGGGDGASGAGSNAAGSGASGGSTKNRKWLFVYLCGSVQKPGVYRVGAGTRLNAAVALAGGLTVDGDGNAVNMARPVVDGERIYIPKTGERVSSASGSGVGSGSGSGGIGPGTGSGGYNDTAAGQININTANAAALDTIPGIGPTLAARIIDHRQKRNGFTDISQLGEVTGIGPKTLAKIKPYVYVE